MYSKTYSDTDGGFGCASETNGDYTNYSEGFGSGTLNDSGTETYTNGIPYTWNEHSDVTEANTDYIGYPTSDYYSISSDSTTSGHSATYQVAQYPNGTWTEAAAPASLLGAIQNEQVVQNAVKVDYYLESGSGTLDLVQTSVGGAYEVPHFTPAYLSGRSGYQGAMPLGAFLTGNGTDSTFGFAPSTNSMTAHGMPNEESHSLQQAPALPGPPDGVSHTSTLPPTAVLVTLAAAARNPADITIPTQAGTDGSGGEEEEAAVAGGAAFATMGAEDKPRSHEATMNANPSQKRQAAANRERAADRRPVTQAFMPAGNQEDPPKAATGPGKPIQFMAGWMTLWVSPSAGPWAPWLAFKGLDDMQAGLSGGETIVYEKSRELGLSDDQARAVDLVSNFPQVVTAVPKGLGKGVAKALAETGPKSGRAVLFSAGEIEGKAIEGALREAGEAVAKNPKQVVSAAGKIAEGAESGGKALPTSSAIPSATRLSEAEQATAGRLQAQTGRTLNESPHVGSEYIDELGKTYDALGTPKASQFWNEKQFLKQIDKHLLKSNDFTAVDLTGFTEAQITTVRNYINSLPVASQAKIIRIGF